MMETTTGSGTKADPYVTVYDAQNGKKKEVGSWSEDGAGGEALQVHRAAVAKRKELCPPA